MAVTPTDLVKSFYADVWNSRDRRTAQQIIDPDFRFRGSLGPERRGLDGFLDYVDQVLAALGGYTCTIDDLVAGPDKVAARMTFEGEHRAEFFGVPATGKHIAWSGAAFFTVDGGKLTHLWVLGDIDAVKEQLGVGADATF